MPNTSVKSCESGTPDRPETKRPVRPTNRNSPRPSSPAIGLPDAANGTPHKPAHQVLLAVDVCFIVLGAAIGHEIFEGYLRAFHFPIPQELPQLKKIGCLLLFSLFAVLFLQLQRDYAYMWKRSIRQESKYLAKAILASTLITGLFVRLFEVEIRSKVSTTVMIAVSWMMLEGWRHILRSQSIAGLTEKRNVLIVGCGPYGKLLRSHVEDNPELGYVFKGYIDRRLTGRPPNPARNSRPGRSNRGHRARPFHR
jgi:hypothetical protein